MTVLRTERLTIGVMRPHHAAAVSAYRALPEVARLQDWDLPYSPERAAARIEQLATYDDVCENQWISFAIETTIGGDTVLVGDIVAHILEGGGIAEIGFTLDPAHHGNGYATEAASAMVDHLIEHHGVHRIEAGLAPENVPSMRVLENIGMRKEALARSAYLVRGEWVDDLRYAMTSTDRTEWLQRPRTPPSAVELVEVTPEDAYLWARLATHHSQERFVAPMRATFVDALFPEIVDGAPAIPWMRGVLGDGERVAFVMLAMPTATVPEPYLWRLLIDRMHQRRGIGTMVLDAIIAQLRQWGHDTLTTSWGTGPGGPEPFYLRHGFVPTGQLIDDEVEARLTL